MSIINWNPSVEVESSSGIRVVDLYTRHLMKRNVFIQGNITEELANSVMNQLLYLSENQDQEINILINSGGGEVTSGLLIYDLITELKNPVNIYCTGFAGSMAAVLLASGQKGRRFILPHSRTMIHEPLISNGVGGSATSIRTISNSILETRDMINRILAQHTGENLEEIDRATSYDHFMNAEESVEFGLCDEIRGLTCR